MSANIRIIKQPEPGVEERWEFPDGTVGEVLAMEMPDPNSSSFVLTARWRAHEHGMAAEWVEHEKQRFATAMGKIGKKER